MEKTNTKNMIGDSLRSLLKENTIHSITVSEIVKNCGSSRSTFYRHFKDKYDLMNWIYQNDVDVFIKQQYPGNKDYKLFIKISINYIREKRGYFIEIIRFRGQNSFHQYLYEYIYNYFKEQINQTTKITDLDINILHSLHFYCAGAVHTFYKWLIKDYEYTDDEMIQILYDNIPSSLKKSLYLE